MNSQSASQATKLVVEAGGPGREQNVEALLRVLRALFELGLGDHRADAGSLAQRLGTSASEVAGLLVQLDAQGLVRAETARLTLLGLATAVRLPAQAVEMRQYAQHQAREAQPVLHVREHSSQGAEPAAETVRPPALFGSRADAPASTSRTRARPDLARQRARSLRLFARAPEGALRPARVRVQADSRGTARFESARRTIRTDPSAVSQ